MQDLIASFPGVNCLRADHQALIPGLIKVVGEEAFGKVWQLYQEAKLIEFIGGRWQMWGYVDATSGTSRGPVPHSLVAARIMAIFARQLGLGRGKEVLGCLAGSCHDIGKRDERENLGDNAGAHRRAGAKVEAVFGYEVAQIADCAGHSGMVLVLLHLGDPLFKAMFLADQMVEGVEVRPARVKSDRLLREAIEGKHPYNTGGMDTFGRPYFDAQASLADTLEAEMGLLFGLKPVTDLARHLASLLLDDKV